MFVGCGQSYTDLKKLNVKSIVKTLLKWMLHVVVQYVTPTKSLLSLNPQWHRHFHVGSETVVLQLSCLVNSYVDTFVPIGVPGCLRNTIYVTSCLFVFKHILLTWKHTEIAVLLTCENDWWNVIPWDCCVISVYLLVTWQ
jgi:hypothetical protein